MAPETCPHDGSTRNVTDLPVSDDVAELLAGTAVTTCCGSPVTFHDDELCCKCCWTAFDVPV